MKTKSREDLIREGRPYIVYTKGNTEKCEQVFITEAACKLRTAELEKAGYSVTRIQ